MGAAVSVLGPSFEVSVDDDCVYHLNHELGRIILSTHIDDGIGGASTPEVLAHLYSELEKWDFKISALPGLWSTGSAVRERSESVRERAHARLV